MRAVVYDRYGPPEMQRLEDVERPVPREDEVLVRIHATTVNRTDCGWRSAKPFFVRYFIGLRRPKRRILGMEFAGEVEAIGAAVTEFAVGDEVFGVTGFGAHAEFVCLRESVPRSRTSRPALTSKRRRLSATVPASRSPASSTPISARAGASSSTAPPAPSAPPPSSSRSTSAPDVTAVCNTKNLELVRSLGADEVFDYEHEDFTKNGETYDVIFDAVGKHSFRRCKRALEVRRDLHRDGPGSLEPPLVGLD